VTSADLVPNPTPDDHTVNVPRSQLAHWAELAAFALDNPPECIDALLELGEALEEALEAAA
jgi:hypothetical protein